MPASRPATDPGAAYDAAVEKVEELLGRLKKPPRLQSSPPGLPKITEAPRAPPDIGAGEPFIPNRTEENYLAAVLRAKEYIAAGDTFQAQIGQRLVQNAHRRPL